MARMTKPLLDAYLHLRKATPSLVSGLSDADLTPQSADFASPGKWHLAHTTWFFEQFVLVPNLAGYRKFEEHFAFLFNSYYNAVGARHERPRRGLLTRPSLQEVLLYRAHVDRAMEELLRGDVAPTLRSLIELGIQHEQQHQELLLTDLLHLFAQNPLRPAVRPAKHSLTSNSSGIETGWLDFPGGEMQIGHDGQGFAFDLELPCHTVHLRPFRLATRPVTNREWSEFIAAGGYSDPALWLSDGWETVQANQWKAPLYWEGGEVMTLAGLAPIDPDAPVSHISFFEADAYARWRGARLPTEFEWEAAARGVPVEGNFVEQGLWQPAPPASHNAQLQQMFGDVWEWTASPYLAYPGFRTAAGAIGEYNGKFMNGQYVLKGGSCVSPCSHLRASYRNFFQPWHRWQFTGLRLACDR